MTFLSTEAMTPSLDSELKRIIQPLKSPFAWAIVQAIGLRPGDALYAPSSLPLFHRIAASPNLRLTPKEVSATISALHRPAENELVSIVSKLKAPRRIVVFNDESEIEALSLKSFEMVTACLFDAENKQIVRIFDSQPRRVPEYIHVELGELNPSTVAIHCQRIASLR